MPKTYYPTINLLRALAAIMVCGSHLIGYTELRGPLFDPETSFVQVSKMGLNGIYIFFVVSGFVIPLSLAKSNYGILKLPRFLTRRFIRIELPYVGSIILVYLISFIYVLAGLRVFEINFHQIFYHVFYLIEFTKMPWLEGVYWTLAIEFQFYLVMGVLFGLFVNKNKWVMWLSLLAFALLNFVVRNDDRFIFHYSTIFLMGIILFLKKQGRMNNISGYLGILICFMATLYFHSLSIALFSLFAVGMIDLVQVDNKTINRLGDISYSLYLTHTIIAAQLLYLFYAWFNTGFERILLEVVCFTIVLIFAYGYWWLIERPAKQLSKKILV